MRREEGVELQAMCLVCRQTLYTGTKVPPDFDTQAEDLRVTWDTHECPGVIDPYRTIVLHRGRRD